MLRDMLAPGQPYNGTPAEIRALVRAAKERGADGIKLIGPMDRDQAAAALDEAKKVGLPTTVHVAVGESTARDFVDLGANCLEHFYGVADAALDGKQNFPPDMNLSNEIHRFGRAGELYTQANLNPEKLSKLLDDMVAKGVAWSPTMSTYEATRDLIRAQNLPWYKDYLHPAIEEYYKPSLARHGTFWLGWTATQEARWRKNYQVWMATLLEFGRKGGTITVGDDAGYLYGSLYGFGVVRELELQQEAGFAPVEVLRHATVNGASVLGLQDKLGRVRAGFIADLLVVNGNPLQDLHVLNPYGTDLMSVNGQIVDNYTSAVAPNDPKAVSVHGGGIEWTIKDGIRTRSDAHARSEGDGREGARRAQPDEPGCEAVTGVRGRVDVDDAALAAGGRLVVVITMAAGIDRRASDGCRRRETFTASAVAASSALRSPG